MNCLNCCSRGSHFNSLHSMFLYIIWAYAQSSENKQTNTNLLQVSNVVEQSNNSDLCLMRELDKIAGCWECCLTNIPRLPAKRQLFTTTFVFVSVWLASSRELCQRHLLLFFYSSSLLWSSFFAMLVDCWCNTNHFCTSVVVLVPVCVYVCMCLPPVVALLDIPHIRSIVSCPENI